MNAGVPRSKYSMAAGSTLSGSITWDGLLFFTVSFLTLFARFRSSALLLGSYQDDFFYYLKVAQHIASIGVSTFDGTHVTNGYHPLWMAVLVVLSFLFRGTAFFVALQAVSLVAVAVTYVLLLRIFRLVLQESPARVGAFVIGMEALMLIRYGMEVTLTLPLALLLLFTLLRDGSPQTFGRAAWLGFIAALAVLSRLDAVFLLGLLALATFSLPRHMRLSARALTGFLSGFFPLLALYLTGNFHYFHLFSPVSGLVKQAKTNFYPSIRTWNGLRPANRMRVIVLLPQLILLLTSLTGLRRRSARITAFDVQRPLLIALLAFPLVHLTILSMVSDWDIWPWYFYSITLASVAAYVFVARRLGEWVTVRIAGAYACILVLYAAAYAVKGPDSLSLFASSQQVAAYMDAHPGIYLMGDQAGTTGYLSHQPIVQAEGLVMDREFLARMRASQPLREVAAAYHARYYAVLGSSRQTSGCLAVAEPTNAGPSSPKMRGVICHQPLAIFHREADNAVIRIFDASWIQ